MLPRSHLIAYLAAATALGFLAGVLFQHNRTPASPSPPSKAGTAEAGDPAPTPIVNSSPLPRPDAVTRAEKAIADKKWPDAVAAIRELVASGQPHWEDALALILRILNVDDVVEYTLREDALEPLAAEIPFHKHSLPLARASSTFASELYVELAFSWLGEAHEGKFLLEALDGAEPDELPRILKALEGNVKPDMLPDLVHMTMDAPGLGAQAIFLKTIASAGPAAEPALRELASSANKPLADAASAALQFVRPPAAGFLVVNIPGREDGGKGVGKRPMLQVNPLHRGDIITHVGEAKIDSEDAWKKAQSHFGARGLVELKVVRAGQTVTVSYPSPFGAPKGKFVAAGK